MAAPEKAEAKRLIPRGRAAIEFPPLRTADEPRGGRAEARFPPLRTAGAPAASLPPLRFADEAPAGFELGEVPVLPPEKEADGARAGAAAGEARAEPKAPPPTRQSIEAQIDAIDRQRSGSGLGEESQATHRSVQAATASVRADLARIDPAALGETPEKATQVRGALYERLARATTYYTQGGNANVLYSNYIGSKGRLQEEPAYARTCNVTVLGMMLEALGKGAESYLPAQTPTGRAALTAIATYYTKSA